MQMKVRMLELTIYRLMGMAAMLVIAFCFAYADEFSAVREKSSFDRVDNAHLNDSQMMKTGPGNPRFRGTVVKQQETAAPASLLQTTSTAETGSGALCSLQSDCGLVKVFHG
jgi:hypothetical protein